MCGVVRDIYRNPSVKYSLIDCSLQMPLAIVDLPIPPMPLMVTVTSLVNVMLVFNIAVLICFTNFGREVKFTGSVGG